VESNIKLAKDLPYKVDTALNQLKGIAYLFQIHHNTLKDLRFDKIKNNIIP
jgi:hypothetical protein